MTLRGRINTLTDYGDNGASNTGNKVWEPQPKRYMCWVAGDRSRCMTFDAMDTERAEMQAARYFGVNTIRIMSRRET